MWKDGGKLSPCSVMHVDTETELASSWGPCLRLLWLGEKNAAIQRGNAFGVSTERGQVSCAERDVPQEAGTPLPLSWCTSAGMSWGRGWCANSSVGGKWQKLKSKQQKARVAEYKSRTVQ